MCCWAEELQGGGLRVRFCGLWKNWAVKRGGEQWIEGYMMDRWLEYLKEDKLTAFLHELQCERSVVEGVCVGEL